MFARKLKALAYPDAENFAVDEPAFKSLVVWLEDSKIRHMPIEDRAPLRDVDGAGWQATLAQYLGGLECPRDYVDTSEHSRAKVVDWLLGYAVTLEYSENAETYSAPARDAGGRPALTLGADTTHELAAALQLPMHAEDAVLMRAIASLITEKFSARAIAAAVAAKDEPVNVFPLKEMPLGFDTGDHQLNQACKILRLLHIADLRELQTLINELVVQVQGITANPKTNTKLGKVGY